MSALEVGQLFWLEIKKGEKAQNCWNNIKVILLRGPEIKITYMCYMQTLF